MQPVDLLIKNGCVLTMDAAGQVLDNGAVAVNKDRIAAVGPTSELVARYEPARVIDAGNHVIMPGLIDAHAHAGHSLYRNIAEHAPKMGWFDIADHVYFRCSTEEFWAAEARISALERLKFGTTTALVMLGSSPRCDSPAYADAHMASALSLGIHNIVGVGPGRPPWPKKFSTWDGLKRSDHWSDLDEQYRTTETVIRRWHGKEGGRAGVCVAASRLARTPAENDPALVEFYRDQARRMRRLARDYGVVLTGHASIGVKSAEPAQDAMAAVEEGLLGPDVIVAHALGLAPDTIRKFADTGTKVAHCPSSRVHYLQRCPAIELIEAGADVAIATDASAPDRTFDLFKEIRVAMALHRSHFRDRNVLPAGKALRMITSDAARVLGLEHEIGSLEPGKRADIILLNMRAPHLWPAYMHAHRVAQAATGHDVDTVICAGRVLMEKRRVLGVDEEAVMDEAMREWQLMRERSGVESFMGRPKGFWDGARY